MFRIEIITILGATPPRKADIVNMSKKSVTFLTVAMILILGTQASAQERQKTSYTGVNLLLPAGDAADFFDTGFGITGSSQFPLGPALDFVLEGAWYGLPGQQYSLSGTDLESGDLSVLAFTIGALYDAGALEFGAKGGYFFDDLHEWDVMPFAQVSFGRFSIGGEYKALGSTNWGAAYAKFRWQK